MSTRQISQSQSEDFKIEESPLCSFFFFFFDWEAFRKDTLGELKWIWKSVWAVWVTFHSNECLCMTTSSGWGIAAQQYHIILPCVPRVSPYCIYCAWKSVSDLRFRWKSTCLLACVFASLFVFYKNELLNGTLISVQ